MTPIGYSARIPPAGTGNSLADINSDIAFKGNYAFQGHWSGFRVIDISDPANPTQVYNTEACRHTSGQGDVVVHGNILIRTWDSASNASPNENPTCMGHATGLGFEGIHIWDISNPAAPVYKKQVRMSATGNDAGAPAVGCGAHTATGVPDDARGFLYLYVGGSSGTCNGIDIVRISLADLTDAKYLSRATHGRSASCHDNNVLMNVGGTKVGYAMCAGGNGLAMYKFDLAKPATEAGTPASPGGVENPTLIWSKDIGATTGHSGSFTYDGKLLVFGHEPGGGTQASCEASDDIMWRSMFFVDSATGDEVGRSCNRARSPPPRTARGTTSTSCRRTRATTASPATTRWASRCSTSRTRRPCSRSPTPIPPSTRPAPRTPSRRRATGRRTSTTAGSTSPTSAAA